MTLLELPTTLLIEPLSLSIIFRYNHQESQKSLQASMNFAKLHESIIIIIRVPLAPLVFVEVKHKLK